MVKRRRLNRALVIEAAVHLVESAGSVTALSLTALAEALDVRPPSLYNHVTSLEDLHKGLALFGLRSLLDELRRAAFGLVGADAVRATATAYRRFVGLHPGIYPLLLRAPEPHEAELVSLSNELVGFMQLVLATMGLQGDEAIHAIRGLRAILHGFTSLEAGGGYKLDLDLEISFQRLVDSYLAGLTRPAAWLYGQGL